jgi:hypothetical protein
MYSRPRILLRLDNQTHHHRERLPAPLLNQTVGVKPVGPEPATGLRHADWSMRFAQQLHAANQSRLCPAAQPGQAICWNSWELLRVSFGAATPDVRVSRGRTAAHNPEKL